MRSAHRWAARTGAGLLAGLFVFGLEAGFVLQNPESPVYYRYAVVAGERIQVVEGTTVAGDVHSNGDLSLASGARVEGDASAVGKITGPGTVTGTAAEGAPVVTLPSLGTAAELRSLADRVLEGDQTLTDARIDDILFVNGKVTVRGSLNGTGTLLAASGITFERPGASVVLEPGTRLSLLSLGTIDVAQGRAFRGVLRAGQDARIGRDARISGVVIASRQVQLGGDARLSFLSPDDVAPVLEIVAPPAQVEGDTTPAVIVEFSDAASGVDPGSLEVKVDGASIRSACVLSAGSATCEPPELAQGGHLVEASIADRAGNRATVEGSFEIILDRNPPALRIVSPLAGLIVGDATPAIEIEYSDTSGVDTASLRVVLDGVDLTATCTVQADRATCEPPALSSGVHTLEVEVADRRGQRSSLSRLFEIVLSLTVVIDSPGQGELTRADSLDVSGRVPPETDSVMIGALQGGVQDGAFVIEDVPLHEGGNTLTVVARTQEGGIGTATVTIVRDTTPPQVAILSPREGRVTTDAQIAVTGEYNDPVSSNAALAPPVVLVNGVPALVEQRTFFLDDLLLQPGENRIRVTVTDAAGNEGAAEVTVRSEPAVGQQIERLLGNGQTGPAGQVLPEPLVVRLRDAIGNPLPGRRVLFQVTRGGGWIAAGGEEGARLTVSTDEQGLARVNFTLGSRSGAGNHEVTVTAAGFPGDVVFCASARVGEPLRIVRVVGDNQTGAMRGAVSSQYPKPLLTQVFDGQGNPVPGAEVIYRGLTGDGSFGGAGEVRAVTNAQGVAAAVFTLGPQPGANANMVEAGFDGLGELPVVFTISGAVPGPESATAVVGIVLDNQDDPVPGVTLSVRGAPAPAVSDAEGRFRIPGVPVGTIDLHVNGTTTSRPGTWPHLAFHITTVSGVDNSVGMPIRLLPIDVEGGKVVGGPEEVVISMRGVPGATLTVAPNSVTFPDGSRTGVVSFTQVHSDKVPMIAPMGSGFSVAFTVQPPGTHFDPPARVTLPNTGLPPGSEVDVFSFDHDMGEFISAGTATVTEDGLLIRSNPGSGISKAGWAGGVPPPPPLTNACKPGTCTNCVGGMPVPKCSSCQSCSGTCTDLKIEKVTASADGKDDMRITAKKEAVNFSAVPMGTCSNVEYEWDFGDPQSNGNTASGQSASHTYEKPGAYTVKVTASCGPSCTSGGTQMDDIKVLVVGVDLVVQDLPEQDQAAPHEEDPGAVLGVRDGQSKYRAPVKVMFEGPEVKMGELKLAATSGQDKLKLFQDAGGNSPVALPKVWQISNGNLTESLFLEATKPSDSVKDIELSLTYTHDGAKAEDMVKATAIAVDLRVDSDNDGSITDTDDNSENQTPGAIVLANDDDDNNNNTADRSESSSVAGEDDLTEMKLALKPSSLTGLTGLKLEIVPGSGILVWKDASKGAALQAGTMLTIGSDQIPDTLWLEGTQPGQSKVQVILRNDKGETIADDEVQVVVVRVEDVDIHASDPETFKTPSAQPPGLDTKLHFVTAWKQGNVALVVKIMPDLPEIRQKVKWETSASGVTLTSPGVGGDELTTSFPSVVTQGVKVPVTIKIKEKVAKEVVAWVVSASLSGSVTPAVAGPHFDPNNTTRRDGTIVLAVIQPVATIFPPEIITDQDRPMLEGGNVIPPPPPNGLDACGVALAGGANARWDISRRVAKRATVSSPTLPVECNDRPPSYPTDPLVGNDDATTNDLEDNNPYRPFGRPVAASTPHGVGEISGFDGPTRGGPGIVPPLEVPQFGVVGDTYRSEIWFSEFVRLQLGDASRGGWFVISDPLPWRVDFKLHKLKVTEQLWQEDVNKDGDMMDDVTEGMVNRDVNGDGFDPNQLVGYWENNGSTSADDNAGIPP